ncbi:MAG: RloB domain-containing protein [Planctomycetaceae bacterium]|nr:MAG: RloB domain-containing protein [Planctomycetaceae bacterium]
MGRRNRNRKPARPSPFRDAKKRILLVCEGVVTEVEYIDFFLKRLRSRLVFIETVGLGADPKTVVAKAKRMRDENRDDAKKADDKNVLFDEVWCAFDRDDHPTWDAAVQMAKANTLELAASNPSVELWLLLHFRQNPGMRDRKAIAKMLSDHLSNYNKHLEFDALWPMWQDAADRAERMDDDAIQAEEAHRNPTTGFYRLVRSIYNSCTDQSTG